MSHPSKKKGNGFEREVVDTFHAFGHDKTERAWGSNGQSKGWHEEVDVLAKLPADLRIQCKRRAKLPDVARPSEHVDAQVIREDRGDTFIVMPLTVFLTLIKEANNEPGTQCSREVAAVSPE